ncbi:hypothetical protein AAMO2058_000265700 [Amorphochlora amoebiformis]
MKTYGYHDWQTYVAFGVFVGVWLLIFKSRWPCLPIGRPTSAILGATLMVMSGILSADEAYASVDAGTLLLLMGLMMILGILEAKGVVGLFVKVLMFGNVTPLSLLTRVSVLSGVMSAFIMNDGAALILSLVVVKICNKYTLPLAPYMMAMATSANIGSAATPLGNPKNMVVHSEAQISFIAFVYRMAPPAMIGVILNTLFVTLYFKEELTTTKFAKIPLATDSDSDGEYDEIDRGIDKDLAMLQRVRSLSKTRSLSQTRPKEDVKLLGKASKSGIDTRWMNRVSKMQYRTFEEIIEKDPEAKDIYDYVRMSKPSVPDDKGYIDPGPKLNLAEKFGFPVNPQVGL